MKRWTPIGMLLAAALLFSGDAWAGASSTSEVSVWTYRGEKVAYGNMRSTRLGVGATQFIYCGIDTWETGNPQVLCGARESSGDYVFCSSTNYRFRYAVAAMSDNAHIHFIADSRGRCKYIHVRDSSVYLGLH